MLSMQAAELQTAIQLGSVQEAQLIARQLAEAKAKVIIRIDEASTSSAPDSDIISVKVNFEDKRSTAPTSVVMDVNPNLTCLAMKKLIHERYSIPTTSQRFIVGRVWPKDSDMLSRCGLLMDNAELFVYVMSATVTCSSTSDSQCALIQDNAVVVNHVDISVVPPAETLTSSATVAVTPSVPLYPPSPAQPTWQCAVCTYENHHSLPMCEMCDSARQTDEPDVIDVERHVALFDVDMIDGVPDILTVDANHRRMLEQTKALNYDALVAAEYCNVIENTERFECAICFSDVDVGCGIVLRECLHMFCRTCLAEHIGYSENAVVSCPFDNGQYKCHSTLQDREIRALVTDEVYEKHLQRSAREAESRDTHSYHCATPDCTGWCTYDDDVNTFFCYVCRRFNCLTCRAIHDGQNCLEYQRELRAKKYKDPAAMLANSTLEVVIIKKDGCDWIQCTVCKTEICWVTKQARWGPKGRGDTSGGCRCRIGGKLCHPKCGNCH